MKTILGALNGEFLHTLAETGASTAHEIDAAVAYTDGSVHPFLSACKRSRAFIRFYGLLEPSGGTTAAFLQELLSLGPSRVAARLVNGHFHCKVIWWHGFGAYIGSANLTQAAWLRNIEAGTFFTEAELQDSGTAAQLVTLFAHLGKHAIPVDRDFLGKLREFEADRNRLSPTQDALRKKFGERFGKYSPNPPLRGDDDRGLKHPAALINFVREWMGTLHILRELSKEFESLRLRPNWVDADAVAAVHFDQFLHAYYYDYVRGGGQHADEEDDLAEDEGTERTGDRSTAAKVEASYRRNKADPGAALREGARWWAGLTAAPYNEDHFIANTAPTMRQLFTPESIETWSRQAFVDAIGRVNAFRTRARQTRNDAVGLEGGAKRNEEERVSIAALRSSPPT